MVEEYRARTHDCRGRRRRLESSRNCGKMRDFMALKCWYSCRVSKVAVESPSRVDAFGGAEFRLCLKQPISAQILLFSNSNSNPRL